MWRNKTVQNLLREHRLREQALMAQNEQLLDRIMHMADRPWTPAPADVQETTVEPADFVHPEMYVRL